MAAAPVNLGTFNPSSQGPQNQNVISYSGALTQELGCDPLTGCMGPFTPPQPSSPASLSNPQNSGYSLGDLVAEGTANVAQNAAPASAASPSKCAWYDYACQFSAPNKNILGFPVGQQTGQGAGTSNAPAFSWGRIAAFLLGLILIGAGLLLFRSPVTISAEV